MADGSVTRRKLPKSDSRKTGKGKWIRVSKQNLKVINFQSSQMLHLLRKGCPDWMHLVMPCQLYSRDATLPQVENQRAEMPGKLLFMLLKIRARTQQALLLSR